MMSYYSSSECVVCFFFYQAKDGIRDLVRSRGLGDVYKRQLPPGYENGFNNRFNRLIELECMSCHNAFPEMVLGLSLIHI